MLIFFIKGMYRQKSAEISVRRFCSEKIGWVETRAGKAIQERVGLSVWTNEDTKDSVGGARDQELKKHTSDLQTALNQTKEDNDAIQRKKQRSQRKDR